MLTLQASRCNVLAEDKILPEFDESNVILVGLRDVVWVLNFRENRHPDSVVTACPCVMLSHDNIE